MSIKDPDAENVTNTKATLLNYSEYALIYNDEFTKDCEIATLHAVDKHCKAALEALEKELTPLSNCIALNCCELQNLKYFDGLCDNNGNDLTTLQSVLDATPFRELIVQSILVNKIHVKTEQILGN